ncbi:adenylyl-sulfate kinase [Mucilaginibacter sp. P25]|uniref:Adenylyl-sulfate kinase n=2 Tax=Mucilaginibacter TaxID=423349 RepID=A0AAE6JJ45_9SPHI|nr:MULTISPECIES: adenylyl-sulfate kinase [Mucilaginibacter]QEM06406.1 adenylyl-sulfate kinase [Mucilaginibacter rubeus]QEM18990.1 adenylyl-sulfate kinase [Mucilaginibacter gossypii]QTE35979.1 adenylyl-sulfate kinase [Mucilaginibacter gossypii]QTE44468.1 adenylyl-sulfate kinase [Mucilaginibacter rubeus]QTE51066.1 adenylyl-sulfate kinase [Mucilaginibacter rubeus]
MIILLCGLSGSGKTTLAQHVKMRLSDTDIPVEIIDADVYRQKLFPNLGYTREDRFENIRRLGFIAGKLSGHGVVTIVSAINPYDVIRRELIATYPDVKLIHIDCPVKTLLQRDTKGLYKRALLPEGHPDKVTNLSGVNDPFQIPSSPDLYINTHITRQTEATEMLAGFILDNYQQEQIKQLQPAGRY